MGGGAGMGSSLAGGRAGGDALREVGAGLLFAAGGPSALGRAAVRRCLSLGLVLWSANLAFLVFVALPRVIGVL